jgi:hypothetical protein
MEPSMDGTANSREAMLDTRHHLQQSLMGATVCVYSTNKGSFAARGCHDSHDPHELFDGDTRVDPCPEGYQGLR